MNENYPEKWIEIEDSSNFLGVAKDNIRNWIKNTDIHACKIGILWEFKCSKMD